MDQYYRETICDLCRKAVPVSDIKYVPYLKGKELKMALCSGCREKNAKPGISQKPNINQDKNIISKNLQNSRASCVCSRCNFKFKTDNDLDRAPNCPYCGKSDRINKLVSADKIVKSANVDDE